MNAGVFENLEYSSVGCFENLENSSSRSAKIKKLYLRTINPRAWILAKFEIKLVKFYHPIRSTKLAEGTLCN